MDVGGLGSRRPRALLPEMHTRILNLMLRESIRVIVVYCVRDSPPTSKGILCPPRQAKYDPHQPPFAPVDEYYPVSF